VTRAVQNTRELARIIALPRRAPADDLDFTERLSTLLRRPGGTQTLRPVQARALYEAAARGGLFGPIRVGGGKTLLSLLAAVVLASKRPILLLPAKLVDKTKREMVQLARHWRIPTFLRIESYEKLSRLGHARMLEKYRPDLIVADEVHKLRHHKTAVTKRVARYMSEHPETRFVGLSGTITKRSLRDYEHIIRWCLKPLYSPVPNHHGEIEDWADCLDEHNRERVEPGALVVWTDGDPTLSVVRAAFRARLVETCGVVSTVDSRVACSLVVRAARYEVATEAAFARLRDLWETPNGEPLTDGMSVWRHARELALGFFYRWKVPAPPDWLAARKAWASCCRKILGSNQRRLDSELAVIHAVDEGHYPYAVPLLRDWRAIKATFEPDTVAEWICLKPVEFAAEWARQNTGIVWTEHVAFANKLAEVSNLRYYGRNGEDAATGRHIEAHDHDWSMIASIASNSEGRNLQAWSRGLVVSCPPNGSQIEQLLGRMHRDGQEADEVVYDVMLGCAEHLDAFWRAFRDSHYVQQTTGAEQKLLIASIDIPPEITEDGARWNR
jgi:hypothetical protein